MRVRDFLFSSELSRPHFGRSVVLVGAWFAATTLPGGFEISPGERGGPVTMLAGLPEAWLAQPVLYKAARALTGVAAVVWACQVAVPWSAWATALAYTVGMSLWFENSASITHVNHLTAQLLWINALWQHHHHRSITAALDAGTYWRTPLYPRWAYGLSVLAVTVFHAGAGLYKLISSGFGWANGVSLQLWIYLWGHQNLWARDLIISNRPLAFTLQVVTLVVELGAVAALWSWRWRAVCGVALLGLYVGIINTFGYPFRYNAVWTAIFFLPVERSAAVVAGWLRRRGWSGRLALRHLSARWASVIFGLLVLYPQYLVRPPLVFPAFLAAALLFVGLLCLDGQLTEEGQELTESISR